MVDGLMALVLAWSLFFWWALISLAQLLFTSTPARAAFILLVASALDVLVFTWDHITGTAVVVRS